MVQGSLDDWRDSCSDHLVDIYSSIPMITSNGVDSALRLRKPPLSGWYELLFNLRRPGWETRVYSLGDILDRTAKYYRRYAMKRQHISYTDFTGSPKVFKPIRKYGRFYAPSLTCFFRHFCWEVENRLLALVDDHACNSTSISPFNMNEQHAERARFSAGGAPDSSFRSKEE